MYVVHVIQYGLLGASGSLVSSESQSSRMRR